MKPLTDEEKVKFISARFKTWSSQHFRLITDIERETARRCAEIASTGWLGDKPMSAIVIRQAYGLDKGEGG